MGVRDRQRGFTLVELLVVIIIIGILAAIAIPAFLNQRTKGFDATVKSDLKSAQTAVETWMAGGGSIADMHRITNTSRQVVLAGKNVTSSSIRWNNFPELGHAPVSDSTLVQIITIVTPENRWAVHAEGDYCLTGINDKSSYNYVSSSAGNYDKILYIDPQAGGLRTMEQLVERRKNGGMVSCKGYVDLYMVAKGIPIPAAAP